MTERPAHTSRRHPESAGDANVPRLVFWELTARCNLTCKHCRAEAQSDFAAGELTTAEVVSVARDIREAADPILILTGGEPLERPDFFDIASASCGIFTRVALATNGTRVDASVARDIAGSGIQRASISLDGATADTHDSFRGQPGSFDAALRGLEALRAAGLSTQINTTLARHNIAELQDLLKLAIDADADAFHVFVLVPVGCGAELPPGVRLSGDEMESTLRWLLDRFFEMRERIHIKATCAPQYYRLMAQVSTERGLQLSGGHGMHAMTRGCLAGSSVCFISRTGDVQPCGYLPVCAGNVMKQPFADIWRNAEIFKELRDVTQLKGKCGVCGFRKICQGCRARAFAEQSDYLQEDPDCTYSPRGSQPTQRFTPADLEDHRPMNPEIIQTLQAGIPIVSRPFDTLADRLGLSGDEILKELKEALAGETARRWGAIFDSSSLGYKSTLCAVTVPAEQMEDTATILLPNPGVTHCYEREGTPNLWFTLTARADSLDAEVHELADLLAPYELLNLPATRRFKIAAVFNVGGKHASPSPPAANTGARSSERTPKTFSAWHKAVVRATQKSIPVSATPFADLSRQLGCVESDLINLLEEWRNDGVLRRIALVMRHRQLGFSDNGMCVWSVPDDRVEECGRALAACREVTHCYERPRVHGFPCNLYAMIHARSRESARRIARSISEFSDLPEPKMLISLREFKKTSPVFFVESSK